MPARTKITLPDRLHELLTLEGYTPRAAAKLFGVDLEEVARRLESVLGEKIVPVSDFEELQELLTELREKAREKKLPLLEGFFSSALLKLLEKEVGEPVTEVEYIKFKGFSRRKALSRFQNWAKKRFSRVALLLVERPVPEKLGEVVKTYGPFELRRDAQTPNKFLVVATIYRKDKGVPYRLIHKKVVGEIEVEP